MDILNFDTQFGKWAASKIVSSVLSKKLGYEVNIDLKKLHICNRGGQIKITFAGSATTSTDNIKF